MTPMAILGAGGLLGSAFRRLLAGSDPLLVGRDALDPDRPEALERLLDRLGSGVVVNCAAHTDVEGAERDPETDFRANAQLPAVLARLCRKHDLTLIHFSSTGCYGNWKDEPYTEDDPPHPSTAHHRAKLAGEIAIAQSGCRHLIARTGWLYGAAPENPKNFVWKRLIEARGVESMTSDTSQRGCPTYAPDVARQMLTLLEAGASGLFNVTAQGTASRYEYVAAIVASAGLPCRVLPGPAFPRLAAVSPNETSANARLVTLGLDHMPHWREALGTYVAELLRSPGWTKL